MKLTGLILLFCIVAIPRTAGSEIEKQFELPSDSELYETVKKKVQEKGDAIQTDVKRLGNQTLQLEAYLPLYGNMKDLPKVLSDYSNYRTWILNNINNRPAGGHYFTRLLDIVSNPRDASQLGIQFMVDLPLFKHKGERKFRLNSGSQGKNFFVTAESLPQPESVVESAYAILKVFPAEKRTDQVWAYLKAKGKVRIWILYEALPEPIMQRESASRIEIVRDNYRDEESRLRERSLAVQSK